VCVCACVRACVRERESVCVYVCACLYVAECVCVMCMWTVVWTNACVRASMQCNLYAPSKSEDVVVREHLCA